MRNYIASLPEPGCVIYCLIDPRDELPKYVGSSRSPKSRYKEHYYEGKNVAEHGPGWHRTKKQGWIARLHKSGLDPIMIRLEVLPDAKAGQYRALRAERKWIRRLEGLGCPIMNSSNCW